MRFHRNPKYASYDKMLMAYQKGASFSYSAVNYYQKEVTFYSDVLKMCHETLIAGLIACKRCGICRDVRGIIAQYIYADTTCEGYLRRAAYILQNKYPMP
jgi:hypothetical protein